MSDRKGLKPLPALETDEEAEDFVDSADLTEYDLSGFQPAHFELHRKTTSVHLRLSEQLFDAVKEHAQKAGIPVQRFIREAVEKEIGGRR